MSTIISQKKYSAFYTRCTTNKSVNKRFALKDGQLTRLPGSGQMTQGTSAIIPIYSMRELATHLDQLTTNQLVTWGLCQHSKAEIRTKKKAQDAQSGTIPIISRTRENFRWNNGQSILLLDYDTKPGQEPKTPEILLECLYAVCPALRKAPMIVRPSGSTYIYHGEKCLVGPKGIRILVLIEDGNDTERAGKVLFERLWLAGHGYIFISQSGARYPRTLLDNCVWQPEREDFCAGATCIKPLERRPPATQVLNDGNEPLNTLEALPDLTPEEEEKYQALVEIEMEKSQEEAQKQKEAWIETHVEQDLQKEIKKAKEPKNKAKLTPEEIGKRRETLRQNYRNACGPGWLHSEFVLYPSRGGSVRVAELLKDPQSWHGETFADPLEPDYNGGSTTTAKAYLNQARPIIHSFSHGGRNFYLGDREAIEVFAIPCLKNPEATKIADALRSNVRSFIVVSPTGSGKTYESGRYFLELLARGEYVVYVASNRTDQTNFEDLLKELAKVSDIEKLGVQLLYGGSDAGEEEKDGRINLKRDTLGVITHKTYLQRKGISDLFYIFFQWIQEHKPHMIIDEADDFCNSLANVIQIGARYKKRMPEGAEQAEYDLLNGCPAFDGSGNCQNCYFSQHQKCKSNAYSIFEIVTAPQIEEEDFPTEKKLNLPELYVTKEMILGNMVCQNIQKQTAVLAQRKYRFSFAEKEKHNFKKSLEEMIDCSYMPTIYYEYPTINKEIIRDCQSITDENKARVSFPYHVCNVAFLSLKDLAPLEFLRRYAKNIRFLTATISKSNIDFIQAGIQDTAIINAGESKQKIDELMVIGMPGKARLISKKAGKREILFQELEKFGRVLIFESKKNKAKQAFKKIPKNVPCAGYGEDSIEAQIKYCEDENKAMQWKTLITHSRGPLGRAVNMPKYFSTLIDSQIYKPSMNLNLVEHTEAELQERKEEDRVTLLLQNGGRILRGEGRKIIIFSHIRPDEKTLLEQVAKEFSKMVKGEVKTVYLPSDKQLKKIAVDWLKNGTVPTQEDLEKLDTAKKTANRLSPKQREQTREERKATVQESRIEKLWQAWKEFDGTWRAFQTQYHLYRLKKDGRLTEFDLRGIKAAKNPKCCPDEDLC